MAYLLLLILKFYSFQKKYDFGFLIFSNCEVTLAFVTSGSGRVK